MSEDSQEVQDRQIPELPNDVISAIAEILVSEHYYGTCASLNMTCRGIHQDTKAILWRIVVIPRTWSGQKEKRCRRLLDASGAAFTQFILDWGTTSASRCPLNGHQRLTSRLKAWISFDRSDAAIFAHLFNGYHFGSRDSIRLMQALDIYRQLISRSSKGYDINLSKLIVTRMSDPWPRVDIKDGQASYSCAILPSWVRSLQVGLHSTLGSSPALLAELAVEFSKNIGRCEPSDRTAAQLRNRSMTHFILSSPFCTDERNVACAEALQVALKANPFLLTVFIKIESTVRCPDLSAIALLPMLDIILPEVYRAFAITKDSQYIDIIVGKAHVALTCIHPGLVQVQHLTATPVVIETYRMDGNGSVVKVRSGTTYPQYGEML